jgi:hypothetical protein
MMARAVLFELGAKGRGLREDDDTQQEQNQYAPLSETRLSCHLCDSSYTNCIRGEAP